MLAIEARKLADFITSLDSFETYEISNNLCYEHIGAFFTDIILQSGLNYKTVVKPRVQHILLNYPEAYTLPKFNQLISEVGLEKILRWKHPVKLNRFNQLIKLSNDFNISSCINFKVFLLERDNRERLLSINGIGPKTVDYALKLLNFDTVAVDRHIYSFVEMADIKINGYQRTKQIVEYAADFLQVSRSTIDYSIWKYMSSSVKYPKKDSFQMEFEF